MSVGLKKGAREISFYQPVSRLKKKSVTLVEMLVVVFILGIITAGVLASLKTGELFFPLSSMKIDLQARIRGVADSIVRDTRQAVVASIVNNSPTDSYIKFQQVQGLDTGTGQYILSIGYIEYVYDSAADKITRNVIAADGASTESWSASNITQPPFYTRDSGGNEVALNQSDLNLSGRLIISINAQKQLRGTLNVPSNLKTEVKIRND